MPHTVSFKLKIRHRLHVILCYITSWPWERGHQGRAPTVWCSHWESGPGWEHHWCSGLNQVASGCPPQRPVNLAWCLSQTRLHIYCHCPHPVPNLMTEQGVKQFRLHVKYCIDVTSRKARKTSGDAVPEFQMCQEMFYLVNEVSFSPSGSSLPLKQMSGSRWASMGGLGASRTLPTTKSTTRGAVRTRLTTSVWPILLTSVLFTWR